jgi:tetratricopeptide (TPR) repeat protein
VHTEKLADRLQQLAPRNPDCLRLRAEHLEAVGRVRKAIQLAEQAHEIDPLDPLAAFERGRALHLGGRNLEARRILEGALVCWPDPHNAAAYLIMVCVHARDWRNVDALLAPERLAKFPLRGAHPRCPTHDPAAPNFAANRNCPMSASSVRSIRLRAASMGKRRDCGESSRITDTKPCMSRS